MVLVVFRHLCNYIFSYVLHIIIGVCSCLFVLIYSLNLAGPHMQIKIAAFWRTRRTSFLCYLHKPHHARFIYNTFQKIPFKKKKKRGGETKKIVSSVFLVVIYPILK